LRWPDGASSSDRIVNLLLVSLDSVRLDHVSRTGEAVHTPRFDAATAEFLFADHCFSVASATRPVHASLLSGLYPFEHGIEGQRSSSLRRGIPLLFRTLAAAGYSVAAFSEAATVFTGLDLGAPLVPLPPEAAAGLNQLGPWLHGGRREPICVFAHYWEAHTPYGAADGLAMGQTLELLRAGRLDLVRERYAAAVTRLLEHKIAPLVEACDLERWCVLIFSDHGESWDAQEPYHGETLRNSVLRVPLYLHVPFSGNAPFPCPLMSLVDVYPTLCGILEVQPEGRGFGRDWRLAARDPVYLGQITPSAPDSGRGDLDLAILDPPVGAAPRRWSVFDREWKYRWEEKGSGVLEATLSGEAEKAGAEDPRVANLLAQWQRLCRTSPYAKAPPIDQRAGDQRLLDQRLRELGYL